VPRFVPLLPIPALALLLALGLAGPAAAQACPADCSGRGLCFAGECVCGVHWTGPDCSVTVGGCPNDCSGQGVCSADGCLCDAGFAGDACDVRTAADGELTGTWTVRAGFCKELDVDTGQVRHTAGKRIHELGLVDLLVSHRGSVADGFFAGLPFVGFVTPHGRHASAMAGAQCTDVAAQPAAFLHVKRATHAKAPGRHRHRDRLPWMDVRLTQGDDTLYRSCWLRLVRTADDDPGVPTCPYGP